MESFLKKYTKNVKYIISFQQCDDMRVLDPNDDESEKKRFSLDEKDRRILATLAHNARTPQTTIAHQVGLSRDVVRYRIQRMATEGVLRGTRAIVDVARFGFRPFHLFVRADFINAAQRKQWIEKVAQHANVRAMIGFSGVFDFQIAFVAHDASDAVRIVADLITSLDVDDACVLEATATQVAKTFPSGFLEEGNPHGTPKIRNDHALRFDEKHRLLLRIIGDHVEMPYHEMARRLELSPDAITYRLRQLERHGYLLKYVPVINYDALGFEVTALLIKSSDIDRLMDHLEAHKHILWAIRSLGNYDAVCYCCTRLAREVHEVVREIRPFTRRVEVLLSYREYAYTYMPACLTK